MRQGPSEEVLPRLASELEATAVFANRRHEPAAVAVDARVAKRLDGRGIPLRQSEAALLFEPGSPRTRTGGPFQVFTPFWRACLGRLPVPTPLPAPREWHWPRHWPESLRIADLPLAPAHPWAPRVLSHWTPGEAGALASSSAAR